MTPLDKAREKMHEAIDELADHILKQNDVRAATLLKAFVKELENFIRIATA